MTDGGHKGYLRNFPENYVPPVGEGLWTLTPRLNGDPSLPCGLLCANRSFLPTEDDVCNPSPPTCSEVPGPHFMLSEVYEVSRNLTDEQAEIARFWTDVPARL